MHSAGGYDIGGEDSDDDEGIVASMPEEDAPAVALIKVKNILDIKPKASIDAFRTPAAEVQSATVTPSGPSILVTAHRGQPVQQRSPTPVSVLKGSKYDVAV